MPHVASRSDGRDVHALRAHMFGGAIHQLPRYPAALVTRIDGDDVDDAHALVEGVEDDGGETDRPLIGNRDEDVPVDTRCAARPHGFSLSRSPVRLMKAREDRVTQYLPDRLEH